MNVGGRDLCNRYWQYVRNQDDPTYSNSGIQFMDMFMEEYFFEFSETDKAETWLEVAMFLANEALLTTTATTSGGRPIYFHPGRTIAKPKQSLSAVIAISVLLGLQVSGLCLLMWFILHTPKWTDTLDADALAQIGGQLKEWGESRPELSQIPGLVGVERIRHSAETSSVRLSTTQDEATQPRSIQLGLGAEGLVTRKALKRMEGGTIVVNS